MLRPVRSVLLASLALALTACGGSGAKLAGGKEGAAQALFMATQAGSGAMAAAGSGRRVSATSVMPEMDMSVDCAEGGKVSMRFDFDESADYANGGELAYTLDYDDCSQDGRNSFDGSLLNTMVTDVDAGGESFSMAMKLEGKLDISGEVDDFVEADITQSMDFDFEDVQAGTGTVVVRLTGTIKTSTATYTYDGSPLTVTVGALPAEAPQS
jgi:hypothetical protein